MKKIPVIAVFDIGKTNKKLFLFDEDYRIVLENSTQFSEIKDEDGDPCENLEYLTFTVLNTLKEIQGYQKFEIKAVNFSAYGASLIYLDNHGNCLTPLYNYLKSYPANLAKDFYDTYGGERKISSETASPVLGSLNSGMQLYRIKKEKPGLYEQIKYALHLPQYLSYLISKIPCSDITSIGCHTQLWDFNKNDYHEWVKKEGLHEKLAPLLPSDRALNTPLEFKVGTGLHDSSAALIPYLVNFHEPFVLISTGTWCISLNPFNDTPLTDEELANDCLSYLTYQGNSVKASRIFAGFEHEQQVKRIADHFNQKISRYSQVKYDPHIINSLKKKNDYSSTISGKNFNLKDSGFSSRNLNVFENDVEAYHQLMLDIVLQQQKSTQYVLNGPEVSRIFVDGGFSKNSIYMNLLSELFPEKEIYAASMAQATALGTALAIHSSWNKKALPNDLIELKFYSHNEKSVL